MVRRWGRGVDGLGRVGRDMISRDVRGWDDVIVMRWWSDEGGDSAAYRCYMSSMVGFRSFNEAIDV